MTVTLPKPNFSWMSQLAGALSPQHQQMGGGYFPPAPAAPGAVPGAAPQSGLSGTFLGSLFNQMPANQAATNRLQQPFTRLGG